MARIALQQRRQLKLNPNGQIKFFNEVFIIYTLIPVFIQTRRILTGLALLNQVLEVETNPELLDESLRSGRLRLAPLLPLLQQVKF